MIGRGNRPASPGTGNGVPTPAAVAPTSTILPVYFEGGILPFSTS